MPATQLRSPLRLVRSGERMLSCWVKGDSTLRSYLVSSGGIQGVDPEQVRSDVEIREARMMPGQEMANRLWLWVS